MCNEQLFPWEPPDDLGDETIAQLIELLDEITRSLENHYAVRLRRYYQASNPRQPDLWD